MRTALCENSAMDSIAIRLKAARIAKGYARAIDAVRAFGWTQSTYFGHENGDREPGDDNIRRYSEAYGVTPAWLAYGEGEGPSPQGFVTPQAAYKPPPEIFGDRDLPVFASTEAGDGAMVIYTEPVDFVPRPWYLKQVKDGYAVLVNGTSMEPVYDPGDMVIVNPKAPLVKGKDVIIVGGEEHGEFKASLKRYLGQNNAEWILKQFNPPDGQEKEFRRFKHEWPRALRVVGSYDGT